MLLSDESGNQVPVELDGPGGVARIAVGEPGHRSSVWRVWANRNLSDVYVAARNIAGIQKFSLHASGDWRHQWTKEAIRDGVVGDGESPTDRILDRWDRPEANAVGIRKGLSIWVPHGYLNRINNDAQGEGKVIWIPGPREDHAVGLHITVCTPDLGWAAITGARPIAAFSLINDEVVVIYASETRVEQAWFSSLEEHRLAGIAQSPVTLDATESGADALTMALFGFANDDGHRVVFDIAAFPSQAINRLDG